MLNSFIYKIDKFYLALAGVLLVLAVLVIFTVRGIFSAVGTARQVDENLFDSSAPRLNKTDLTNAFEAIGNVDRAPLDLRE